MSNVKHPKCTIRNMANEAKARLQKNTYAETNSIPKNITNEQQEIYFKLKQMKKDGTVLINPVAQLGDEQKLENLTHEERQRYIINLLTDYVKVKQIIESEIS